MGRVEGDFELVDQDGKAFGLAGRTRVSLCRCGQSANKPFCDSTHKTCGFQSTVVAFDLEPSALRATDRESLQTYDPMCSNQWCLTGIAGRRSSARLSSFR